MFHFLESSLSSTLVLMWIGLPWWLRWWRICLQHRKPEFDPWRRKWQPTLVFLLENSTDRGAWLATVHGVAKSWTLLGDFHFLPYCILYESFSCSNFSFFFSPGYLHIYFLLPGAFSHTLFVHESRLPGEISITSDMQMTLPLWQKVKRN